MGFKVKFSEITMPTFNQTVGKIYQGQEFDDIKKAYKLKRLVEKIEIHQKSFYSMYQDIQKTFLIDVPAEGEVAATKTIDPERADEFKKKIEELGQTEVDVDWHQMTLNDLEGMKITARDLAMIEPILDPSSLSDLQEVEQPQT